MKKKKTKDYLLVDKEEIKKRVPKNVATASFKDGDITLINFGGFRDCFRIISKRARGEEE